MLAPFQAMVRFGKPRKKRQTALDTIQLDEAFQNDNNGGYLDKKRKNKNHEACFSHFIFDRGLPKDQQGGTSNHATIIPYFS